MTETIASAQHRTPDRTPAPVGAGANTPAQMRASEVALRRLLRFDAAFSGASAALLIALGDRVAEMIGTEHSAVVRIVGVALAAFSIDLVILSNAAQRWLVPGALAIAVANFAWVAASAVTITLGWYSTTGDVAVVVVAVAAGGLGLAEMRARSRIRS